MLYYFDVMFTLCERSVDVNLKSKVIWRIFVHSKGFSRKKRLEITNGPPLKYYFSIYKKHMPIFRILAGLGLELKYWKILISDRILEPKKKDQFVGPIVNVL